MSIKLGQTGVTYPNSTLQSTKYSSELDKGRVIRVDVWRDNATWNKPAGCTKILVQVVGGGGGGCGHCEAGGAGGEDVSADGAAVSRRCCVERLSRRR